MATSLLRLGRLGTLKCLGQDGRGSLRTPLTAAFCSKAEAPKKPAKKTSTLEAPDERAALLAYKTTVAFPTRLSTAGFLSQGVALGEHDQSRASSEESITGADAKRAESVTDDSAKAETESYDVGAAAEATPVAETATEKDTTSPPSADVEAPKSKATPKDDDTSSSSSSSDSDSDSDSDDEKPDKTEKPEPVAKTGDKPGQEEMLSSVSKQPSSDVKTGAVLERVQPCFAEEAPKGAVKRAPQAAEAVSEPTSKEVPAPSTAAAPAEEIIDPAHVLCTAESIKTQAEVIPEKEAGAEVKSSEVPDAVTEGAPDVAAGHAPEAVLDSAPKAASEAGLEIKAAPETMQAVTPAEELGDPAPVITAAEGVRAEPEVAAAPEEAAAAPAPKPQPEPEPEPFDNTSYKNLQHHNYNIYTFVDMDVEMAKHRLPQPSTGRPSPRH